MDTVWWKSYALTDGEWARWQIGPLEVTIEHMGLELRLAWERGADPTFAEVLFEKLPEPEVPDSERFTRYVFTKPVSSITFAPALADRPVVIRPAETLVVPSGESAEIFVSTPVFASVTVAGKLLMELPTWRPSDTWFGTPTEGELCYAGTTRGLLHLDELGRVAHRAISSVQVTNLSRTALPIERLSIPVGDLAMYEHEGMLFTETLEVVAGDTDALTSVNVGSAPPDFAQGWTKVAVPRRATGRTLAHRLFHLWR